MTEITFPLDINGYHFESLCDASTQLGINDSTLYFRYNKGWPVEEVFGFKEHRYILRHELFPLDINGYHFESWADAERQLSIGSTTLMQRYNKGWSLEEIFGFKKHKQVSRVNIFPLDINGYHFVSWSDASRQLGFKISVLRTRYSRGWSLEEVFGFKEHVTISNHELFPLDINGYHFVSWSDASRQLCINDNTLRFRYDQMWSLEEVFGFKEHKHTLIGELFPLDINGYHFVSWSDASRQLKIASTTLMQRYNKGWSLEEIFGFKLKITSKFKINNIKFNKRIGENIYVFIDINTKAKKIFTFDQINEMWLNEKGVNIGE